MTSGYYQPLGDDRFRSTEHAQGAWSETEQHMGPVSGLLVHTLEHVDDRPDLTLSRITFDILGPIAGGDCVVTAHVARSGRTVQLSMAELVIGGRPVVRATAWRVATADTSGLSGTSEEPMPPRATGSVFEGPSVWPGGFIRSLQFVPVGDRRPGRAAMWLRSTVPLLSDAPVSDLATVFTIVDTANGVAVRADPSSVLFPNLDLSVHLFRQPTGPWLGFDTTVSFGSDGTGLTASVLHDEAGPFGRAAQTLLVRPRP